MPLKQYIKKRNFTKTTEPKGTLSHKFKNLFVVQKHAASHLHYDFRLELNGVLLSWAIPKGPCLDPNVKRLAMHVEDHPVEYGYFEGFIPKGQYGGGTVMLWDIGKWTSLNSNAVKAYKDGHLKFKLKANKLNGIFNLIRLNNDDKSWLLIKEQDDYAKPLSRYDILNKMPNSVLSGMSIEEITENHSKIWDKRRGAIAPVKIKENNQKQLSIREMKLPESPMPSKIYPQLAALVTQAPNTEQWLHELKFDGYRVMAYKKNNQVRLMTRNNHDWTIYFKNIADLVIKIPVNNIILDGEIVLLDEANRANFQLLQNAIKEGKSQSFIYYIFDILYYERYNLMKHPLLKRKEILQTIISENNIGSLRFSSYVIGFGADIYLKSCQMGLEGIVSKKTDSIYREGRSKNWLKAKCVKRQEFVIGGYTRPKGIRSYFGSLLLGVYSGNKQLKYCGNVGTGFTQDSLREIYKELQTYRGNENPFSTKPTGMAHIIWLKPKLVAEVEFSEWTKGGMLRHPSFKGLRKDKAAAEIRQEKELVITNFDFLTNPNKVLYPEDGITKLDLANYYKKVHKWILPYICERPLTLVRCPENYTECFYQKHINESTHQTLESIKINEKNDKREYIYIKNIDDLLSLVQLGTLEIHPWGSRIDKLDYPDIITFDIDPAPGITWKKIVETAKLIKNHLADVRLVSFVKTTGGKGLHVVVPIKPEYTWKHIKNFAHTFVDFMTMTYPNDYVSNMSKTKRKGKIFIDYQRNSKGATAIAAYSIRARAGAPVAVPLHWDELSYIYEDNQYNIRSLPPRLQRLKSDPWKNFFKLKQPLMQF